MVSPALRLLRGKGCLKAGAHPESFQSSPSRRHGKMKHFIQPVPFQNYNLAVAGASWTWLQPNLWTLANDPVPPLREEGSPGEGGGGPPPPGLWSMPPLVHEYRAPWDEEAGAT